MLYLTMDSRRDRNTFNIILTNDFLGIHFAKFDHIQCTCELKRSLVEVIEKKRTYENDRHFISFRETQVGNRCNIHHNLVFVLNDGLGFGIEIVSILEGK